MTPLSDERAGSAAPRLTAPSPGSRADMEIELLRRLTATRLHRQLTGTERCQKSRAAKLIENRRAESSEASSSVTVSGPESAGRTGEKNHQDQRAEVVGELSNSSGIWREQQPRTEYPDLPDPQQERSVSNVRDLKATSSSDQVLSETQSDRSVSIPPPSETATGVASAGTRTGAAHHGDSSRKDSMLREVASWCESAPSAKGGGRGLKERELAVRYPGEAYIPLTIRLASVDLNLFIVQSHCIRPAITSLRCVSKGAIQYLNGGLNSNHYSG